MTKMEMKENEGFELIYSGEQKDEVERIRAKYVPKQESKLDKLKKLDKSAEKPGRVRAIALGTIGSLIMGAGMSLAMTDLSGMLGMDGTMAMVIGIVIGVVGMAIAGVAYPLYVSITKKQRAKIADEIIKLSNELSI